MPGSDVPDMPFNCGKAFSADYVFDPAGVFLGGFFVDSETD